METLRDAAGQIIETDACACGRPKLAARAFCCRGCTADPERQEEHHASGCSMRCATMGVPGFGVKAGPLLERAHYTTARRGWERG
jgi:hypothetical protein